MHSDATATSLRFSTPNYSLEAHLNPAGGRESNASYAIRNFNSGPNKRRISPDQGAKSHAGCLSLFRAYCRDELLKTYRSDSYEWTSGEAWLELVWARTPDHDVTTRLRYEFFDPDRVDIHIKLDVFTDYPDYELIFSNYLAPGFESTVLVGNTGTGSDKSMISVPPFKEGCFAFFPRDEHAKSVMEDGRHMRGEWHWPSDFGRPYVYPVVLSECGDTQVLLMGRESDVFAVGGTYLPINGQEDVISEHYAQYIRLFGRAIRAGMQLDARLRCVIQSKADPTRLQSHYAQFSADRT